MDNSATFRVKYDGSALASHEMDVKDLAPALLAIGELIEEANRTLNGSGVGIQVNIKAHEPGCIDVVLNAIQSTYTQATQMFNSDDVNAFLNVAQILSYLGFFTLGGGGLIQLIKWLKNRPIKSITTVDTGDYRIELEDGTARVFKEQEVKLFSVFKIRKSIETIIYKPLKKEGIEKVSFREDNGEGTEIIKDEGDYFVAPPVPEELIDEVEIEQSLQIINIAFQEGGKWKFSDGNATFFADIVDDEFVNKVQKNQAAFAKDDILRVKMKRRQVITPIGIKTEYTITKVVEHRSAAVTIKLPFS